MFALGGSEDDVKYKSFGVEVQQAPCVIDMRSDTVTHPTPAMRRAMAEAEVGDDVLGDDPTVKRLEELGARTFGKEAALFVPTGTMANLICCLLHCEARGSELIVGSESHIYVYEQGGISQLGGVHPRIVTNDADGTLPLAAIEAAIRGRDDHFPITRAVCLETTQNRCGGRVLSRAYIQSVVELAQRHNLKTHIDGARIFNAIRALGITPAEYVAGVDSLSVCLSKGLASPIGSLVIGTQEFCTRARRLRKALGGGMRQVGVIAACGIESLTHMTERLVDDHRNAKALAVGLSGVAGLRVDADTVETNIVYVNVVAANVTAAALVAKLKEDGVLAIATAPAKFRLVTHYQVSSDDVATVLASVTKHMTALCQ